MNIREHLATKGLKRMIEGNYGLPVVLITPDGTTISTDEDGNTLKGQVLYDHDSLDPETGDLMSTKEIRVTLRKTALSQIPVAGETWKVSIPDDPSDTDTLTTYLMNPDESPVDGQSAGFITLKPKNVDQS
ncbi:MAG: hypothetical protein DRP45_11605 [Candidatus Zixiibacteriota bacterium]|nr:MAG: hypothetical protein DRP45_11605 [candidate division Zixibacteria bacterium]